MPYERLADLPEPVRVHLPLHAQEIYRAAFNGAWREYADRDLADREQLSHRVAWAAVKHRYRKAGARWIAQ